MKDNPAGGFLEVLSVFTRLGFTSFGGPVAHLGYFHDELVDRRKWMSPEGYADLVALCQFLPGPASSQVGMGLGIHRAGLAGGFAAWLGFTLPSALVLMAFALGVRAVGDVSNAGWLSGLRIVAVAVVAHAVWGMARKLTPDLLRMTIALLAAMVVLVWPTSLGQVTVIALGAAAGLLLFRGTPVPAAPSGGFRLDPRLGAVSLAVFLLLLLGLPLLRQATGSFHIDLVDSFYRAGSLVFGGGHVVLPVLQAEVVPAGWVDNDTFTAGYGAAQAVPGPLFTFAAFLGAAMQPGNAGVVTGLLAIGAIYLPSVLLLVGVLPFWDRIRSQSPVRAALRGVNAAVVGILLAALYDPVWRSAIFSVSDLALALGAFLLLALWRWPAWLVVLLCAAAGFGLQSIGN